MPKYTLEFQMPEESEEFELAKNGSAISAALTMFYNDTIRARLKYQEDLSESDRTLLEAVKAELFEALNAYDVELF
jgi:hypothetical protein